MPTARTDPECTTQKVTSQSLPCRSHARCRAQFSRLTSFSRRARWASSAGSSRSEERSHERGKSSEAHPPERRRCAGGFLATFVLSVATDAALHAAVVSPLGERMSDPLFFLATAYRAVYTIAGGWVTARLAPHRPMRHALMLGAIGLVAATGLVATWGRPEFGPRWYPIAIVAMALPCVWAGAKLREWQSA